MINTTDKYFSQSWRLKSKVRGQRGGAMVNPLHACRSQALGVPMLKVTWAPPS